MKLAGREGSVPWLEAYLARPVIVVWPPGTGWGPVSFGTNVFRVQTEGGVRWLGIVESIEAAKALIKVESAKQPGDFLVVNLETGSRTEIKADPAA